MEPFEWAAIASAGVNAIGKLMGGASAKAMDQVQAQAYDNKTKLDDFNTSLLSSQADVAHGGIDFAAAKEETDLGKIAEAGRQTLSAQRSYFAGGDLDPTFGSPLLVQAMTAGRVATDVGIAKTNFAIDKANALTTEANLRGQAVSSNMQSVSDRLSATAARMKGDADMTAGYLGAATSLLSAAGGAAGKGMFNFGSGGGVAGTIQVGSQSFPSFGA